MAKRNKDFENEPFPKERALAAVAKERHIKAFFDDPNVLGAGFGRRIAHGESTDEPALVVYVSKKVPEPSIPFNRRLPRRVLVGAESIEVDVFETGPIYPLSFTARERPATQGISISHPLVTAGTLGCVVTDNTDGSRCILSNNHVIANQNAAGVGDPIVQPGTFDGGTAPGDTIATLKRFVPITAAGNTVDAAIAQVSAARTVVDRVHGGIMDPPRPSHPAVGLLFAASCNTTIINPIANVLSALNVSLPGGAGSSTTVVRGTNVEKVGRTTEYTTSTVRETDATLMIPYNFGVATFDNQITTAWMSDGGDSGSIVCRGGAGGNEERCGCLSIAAASTFLGEQLQREEVELQLVRDDFLRHTAVGAYVVDLFYLNEGRMLKRWRETNVAAEDRDLAQSLYLRFGGDLRRAFVDGDETVRLKAEHLDEASRSLARAEKYLAADERRVARAALEMARRAEGANVREAMAILNDLELLKEVKALAEDVEFVETPS